jgi:hypothetical protein
VELLGGGEAVDEEAGRDEEAEGEDEGEAVFGEAFGWVVVVGVLVWFCMWEWFARNDEGPMTLGVVRGQETSLVIVFVRVMKSANPFPGR